MPAADLLIGRTSPNVAERNAGADAAEKVLAVVIEAAQGHVAAGQDGQRSPQPAQGLRTPCWPLSTPASVQLCILLKRTPSVSPARTCSVLRLSEVLQQAMKIRIGDRRRAPCPSSAARFSTTSSNFKGWRIRSNSSLSAPSKLILISSNPASIRPAARRLVEQRSVGEDRHPGDAPLLGVADALLEAVVQKRLAEVVQMDFAATPNGALVDDLLSSDCSIC